MRLNCTNVKIPTKMQGLTDLTLLSEYMLDDGLKELLKIMRRPDMKNLKPSSSNITWGKIADEIEKYREGWKMEHIVFSFYCEKNIFFGHKVVSHANFDKVGHPRINYNTRFSGASTYTARDYWKNFFHELIHHFDKCSPYSFGHKNAKDIKSAPYVVGEWSLHIYDKLIQKY